MKIQIDQSGKIEKTNKNTILCISNGEWDAVLIEAKTKRQMQEIFRRHGQGRNFVLFTFCAGLAILLSRNSQVLKVTIDKEYCGKEAIIKKIVLQMLAGEKQIPEIDFGLIGKEASAHYRASLVANRKVSAKCVVKLSEILAKTKMTEVGKRLKNA